MAMVSIEDNFFGFIAMEALRESLEEVQMKPYSIDRLIDGLNVLH